MLQLASATNRPSGILGVADHRRSIRIRMVRIHVFRHLVQEPP